MRRNDPKEDAGHSASRLVDLAPVTHTEEACCWPGR